jgi:hypothetical protein
LIDNIGAKLEAHFPKELVAKLIEHYKEIKTNFRLARHENNELNASKFSETVFRFIEFALTSKFTPFGTQIHQFTKRCRDFENHPAAGIDESIRIHIPRTLILIVDVRNKRGVGHVSNIHNPNLLDATLVTKCGDWIFAEILRLYLQVSLDEAQGLIDKIIRVQSPVVEKIGDTRRVTDTSLKYTQQVLVLLYNEFPISVGGKTLFDWVEHSNYSVFKRDVLKPLHKKRFIEFKDPDCHLLSPGIKTVEEDLIKKIK